MGKFQPGNPGGPGRPPKIVEEAKQSVLLRLFDEAAEIMVVKGQIKEAKKGNSVAATWLWDRKYGKVKDVQEHSGGLTVRVVYVDDFTSDE
jgi:hypothetical protein